MPASKSASDPPDLYSEWRARRAYIRSCQVFLVSAGGNIHVRGCANPLYKRTAIGTRYHAHQAMESGNASVLPVIEQRVDAL